MSITWRRKVQNIGGGQGLEYSGGGARGGGGKSQQAYDVVMTLMRRNDVASTSCAH